MHADRLQNAGPHGNSAPQFGRTRARLSPIAPFGHGGTPEWKRPPVPTCFVPRYTDKAEWKATPQPAIAVVFSQSRLCFSHSSSSVSLSSKPAATGCSSSPPSNYGLSFPSPRAPMLTVFMFMRAIAECKRSSAWGKACLRATVRLPTSCRYSIMQSLAPTSPYGHALPVLVSLTYVHTYWMGLFGLSQLSAEVSAQRLDRVEISHTSCRIGSARSLRSMLFGNCLSRNCVRCILHLARLLPPCGYAAPLPSLCLHPVPKLLCRVPRYSSIEM